MATPKYEDYDMGIRAIIDKQNGLPNTSPQTKTTKVKPNKTKSSSFNTQAMYDASLAAKNALIEQNYNSQKNQLESAYNTNKMDYELQRGDIGQNYKDARRDIQGQTYRNLESSAVNAANRGITNSAMGMAQDQGVVREGNRSINLATRDRDKMLNDLTTRINNLTQNYQSELSTLEANKGLQGTQALNESLLMKQQADMDLYKFDTGWERELEKTLMGFEHDKSMQESLFGHNKEMQDSQFGHNIAMQESGFAHDREMSELNHTQQQELMGLQHKYNVDLSQLSHTQQKELLKLSLASQEKVAAAARSGNMAIARMTLDQEVKNAKVGNALGLFANQYGMESSSWSKMNTSQKNLFYDLMDKISSGSMSREQAATAMSSSMITNTSYAKRQVE